MSHHRVSRRDVIRTAMVSPAAGLASLALAQDVDVIQRENQKQGTKEWMLSRTRVDPKTKYRCPWVEGYCSKVSVRAGEKISFHVSMNPAAEFVIDIYRTGYYGGAGGRHVMNLGPFKGVEQPEPGVGERRVRECRWEACVEIVIPADWVSGVYVGKLTEMQERIQSYVIFIVRDDRRADFVFQCSDTTWQAYNRWPNQWSLYDDGNSTWYWGPGVAVSLDRPYGKYCQILDQPLSIGSGEWFLWEFPVAYWLESRGYDVTYVSNTDTHSDAKGLMRAKGFLSVGHDEYYTLEMFENLKGAIGQGLNVAFLSGNTCCGRIDLRASSDGRANRVMGRVDRFGPRENARFDSMGKLPHESPNENTLVGARSTGEITGGADWVCVRPGHWLFEGTGMKEGEGIPGLVGWEWHGDPAKIPRLEVVASAETTDGRGKKHGVYTATMYPGGKGNIVFNASTCWWGDGLAEPPGYMRPAVYTKPRGVDRRVQRITENLLERMRKG